MALHNDPGSRFTPSESLAGPPLAKAVADAGGEWRVMNRLTGKAETRVGVWYSAREDGWPVDATGRPIPGRVWAPGRGELSNPVGVPG